MDYFAELRSVTESSDQFAKRRTTILLAEAYHALGEGRYQAIEDYVLAKDPAALTSGRLAAASRVKCVSTMDTTLVDFSGLSAHRAGILGREIKQRGAIAHRALLGHTLRTKLIYASEALATMAPISAYEVYR